MAFFDPDPDYTGLDDPYQGVDPTSLYAAYTGYKARRATGVAPEEPRGPNPSLTVNYADGPRSTMPVPDFLRTSDPFLLNPDPFGDGTARWARDAGIELPQDAGAMGLNVFGKVFSRAQLEESDAGRRLLALEDAKSRGAKRGFLDSLTDISWADAPFLSLFATVGKSVSDAVTVSDTFRKLQNGEAVTDDELIKTRLYMAESDYRANGTWWSTVGDIVRQAPGFMAEFLLSGGLYSLGRTALAKLGKEGIHLGLNRAMKTAAREAVEIGAAKTISREGLTSAAGRGALSKMMVDHAAYAKLAANGELKTEVMESATETLFNLMKANRATLGPARTLDDVALKDLARRRIEYETRMMFARNSSDLALSRGLNSFGQWLGRHVSSGFLDLGMWGTTESTVLTTGFTKARSALADAIGAFGPEAMIRGSLLMLPGKYLVQPFAAQWLGKDGRMVSEAQLSLEQSAYMKGRSDPEAGRRLMASAESYAAGMNWLEYVSENAGRGFGSLMRGAGLFWDRTLKPGVRGIVRPAATASLAAGVETAEHEGFRVGSLMRKWWRDTIGSREDFLKKNLDDRVKILGDALQRKNVANLDAAVLRNSLRTMDSSLLSEDARRVVGPDFKGFMNREVREAYRQRGEELAYKNYGRFWIADFMTRHNLGPEAMYNLFEHMGYDGVLGEMFEERYSDVAKGLMGWDDKDNQTVFERVKQGMKNVWPGWKQLTAEAVGFAVPMVTRMGMARIQASIGGQGKMAKLRRETEAFADMERVPIAWTGKLGDSFRVYQAAVADAKADIEKIDGEIAAAGTDEKALRAAQERKGVAERRLQRWKDLYAKQIAAHRAATREEGVDAAAKLSAEELERYVNEHADEDITMAPAPSSETDTEGVTFNMRPETSESDAANALNANEQFIEFQPEFARILTDIDAPLEGEPPSFMRRMAGKLVGIANAVLTGDFSLAFKDPASWVGREAGINRNYMAALKAARLEERGFAERELMEEARAKALASGGGRGSTFVVPQEDIERRTDERFADRARQMGRAYVAAKRMRMFTQNDVRDQALVIAAKELGYDIVDFGRRRFAKTKEVPASSEHLEYDELRRRYFEGRSEEDLIADGWRPLTLSEGTTPNDDARGITRFVLDKAEQDGYSVDRETRTATRDTKAGRATDEASFVGFDELYRQNREDETDGDGNVVRRGVDSISRDVSTAALDILTRRMTMSVDSRRFLETYVELPANSGLVGYAAYEAAMHLNGMAHVIPITKLTDNKPVEQVLRDASAVNLPLHVCEAIARAALNPDGTWDASRVPQELIETVAFAATAQFDGTLDGPSGLRARNERIVEACCLAHLIREANGSRRFIRISRNILHDDPARSEARIYDGPSVVIPAWRADDGTWECRIKFVGEEKDSVLRSPSGDFEGLVAELQNRATSGADVVSEADSRLLFTGSRVLETDDMVVMMRAHGLLREYIRLTSKGEKNATHPLFRKNDDGTWAFDEVSAAAQERKEAELAECWDGKSLVRQPPTDLIPKDRDAISYVREMWELRYGEQGYVTVAERLMERNNIDTGNHLNAIIGYRGRSGRYQSHINSLVGKGADVIIPVDLTRGADLRMSLVNARLLQAYAQNARTIHNAFAGRISMFLHEMAGLVEQRIRHAEEVKDEPLRVALIDFRDSVLRNVDRFAVDESGRIKKDKDGNPVVLPAAGFTPNMFCTMAATCLLFDKKLIRNGYAKMPLTRVMADIAPYARDLAHYQAFASLVDITLGGSGFFNEMMRTDKESAETATMRGLPGLIRILHNGADAFKETFSEGVAGVSYERFLQGCNKELYEITKKTPVRDPELARLAKLEKLSPREHAQFMTGVYDMFIKTLQADAGMGEISDESVQGYILTAVKFARQLEDAAKASGSESRIAALNSALAAAEDMAKVRKSLPSMLKAYREGTKELDRLVKEVTKKDQELAAAGDKLNAVQKIIADSEESGVVPDPAYQTEADRWKAVVDRISQELAGVTSSVATQQNSNDKVKQAAIDAGIPREQIDDFLEISSEATDDDPNAANDAAKMLSVQAPAAGDAVDVGEYELPTVEAMQYADSDVGLPDITDFETSVAAGFTAKEANVVCLVAVSQLLHRGLNVRLDSLDTALRDMFPSITDTDMALIHGVYVNVQRRALAKGTDVNWARVVAQGVEWNPLDEDKDEDEGADTASEDRRVYRSSMDELTGEDLKTFLKMTRLAFPADGANFQAVLRTIRETTAAQTRALDDASPAKAAFRFLDRIINPSIYDSIGEGEGKLDLDTHNLRDAAFALHLKMLRDDPGAVAGYVRAFSEAGWHQEAFFLSYLMALKDGSLERFSHLISNAKPADAIHATPIYDENRRVIGSRIEPSRPTVWPTSEAALVGVFAPCVRMDRKALGKAVDALENELTRLLDPYSGYDAFGVDKGDAIKNWNAQSLTERRRKVADVIASVLGQENPLVTALRSDETFAKLNSASGVALGSTQKKTRFSTLRDGISDALKFTVDRHRGDALRLGFLSDVIGALKVLQRRVGDGRPATLADVNAVAVAVATTSDPMDSFPGIPEKSPGVSGPIQMMFNVYATFSPFTILSAERDENRPDSDPSVVITSPGTVPLITRWVNSKASNGMRAILKATFQAHGRSVDETTLDEAMALLRQRMEWPVDLALGDTSIRTHNTRIVSKCLNTSLGALDLYDACADTFARFFISSGTSSNVDDGFSGGMCYVPLYAGDKSSRVVLQIPYDCVIPGFSPETVRHTAQKEYAQTVASLARPFLEDGKPNRAWAKAWIDTKAKFHGEENLPEDIKGYREELKGEVSDARLLEIVKNLNNPSLNPSLNTIQTELESNAKSQAKAKLIEMYRKFAQAVAQAVGLDLLGDDTKRAALSTLERPGTSMVGIRRKAKVPGGYEKGTCRIGVIYNAQSRLEHANEGSRGNEEGKGSVFMWGYGAERQRAAAKQQGTPTLKLHLMSTGGRYLSFVKGLLVSLPGFDGGSAHFIDGDPKQVLQQLAVDETDGDAEINTAVVMDFDSYKIGPMISKWLRAVDGDRNTDVIQFIIDRIEASSDYVERDSGGNIVKYKFDRLDLEELKGLLEGATFREPKRSDGLQPPVSIDEILPGLRVKAVQGYGGPSILISYEDPDLTAYSVANVSHKATTSNGRTPRNHVIDMMSLVRTQRQMALDGEPGFDAEASSAACDDLLNLTADWGLAVAATFGRMETIATHISGAQGLRDLRDRQESPDSDAMKAELFRVAWARMRQNLNIPLRCTDMALVMGAAGVSLMKDENGNVRYDENGHAMVHLRSSSGMIADLNWGSFTFTDEERGFYRKNRRLAFAQINVRETHFRYAWWLDEARFRATYKLSDSASDRDILERIEDAISRIREKERREGRPDHAGRRELFGCFLDHHGRSVLYRTGRVADIDDIVLDDLFDDRGGFDRSAVYIENDRIRLDSDAGEATARGHIVLGGTRFGVPRTPSYNGAPWIQHVRASIPVYEEDQKVSLSVDEGMSKPADSITVSLPGRHACVALDPASYEILGCDNDGDKTKTYMLYGSGGRATPPLRLPQPPTGEDLEKFAVDPEARGAYFRQLVDMGFVVETTDPKTGEIVRTIDDRARTAASNRFVLGLFALGDAMPVPPTGGKRRPYIGSGPSGVVTSFFPGTSNARDDIKKAGSDKYRRPGARRTIPEGQRLDNVRLAAQVEDKANDAADARARAVSIAKSLNLAWATGWFDGVALRGTQPSDWDLFGHMRGSQFLNFIHVVDGLSNATFDDIKDQVCSRFGWTKGMLSAFVADLFVNADQSGDADKFFGHPVQGAIDADRVIYQYVDSINNYGSRYFMMASSDDSGRMGFYRAARKLVGGGSDYDGNRWAQFFGIQYNVKNYSWETAPRPERTDSEGVKVKTAAEVVVDMVVEVAKRLVEAKSVPGITSPSDALGMLAFHLRSGNNRYNPTPGALFHLVAVAAGVKFDAGKFAEDDAAGLNDMAESMKKAVLTAEQETAVSGALGREVERFLRWHAASTIIEKARTVGESLNYLGVDPGASTAATKARTVNETGDEIAKRFEKNPNDPFLTYYNRMHAATKAMYNIGYGLMPTSVRGVQAIQRRNVDMETIIEKMDQRKDAALDGLVRGLLTLDSLSESGSTAAFHAEANVQTVKAALAALQTAGGCTVAQNEALLRVLAMAAKAPGTTGGEPKLDEVLQAIESLFEVMYRMAATSSQHYETNPTFGYFTNIDYGGAKDGGKKGTASLNLRKGLAAAILTGMNVTHIRMSEFADAVVSGTAFAGESASQRLPSDRRGGPRGTFVIDAENLAAFRTESSYRKNDVMGIHSETLKTAVETSERILDLLAKSEKDGAPTWAARAGLLDGGRIVITPAVMVGRLLALYAALNSRVLGNSVGRRSLAELIPNLRSTLSRRAALNDRVSPLLMRLLVSTSFNGAPMDGRYVPSDYAVQQFIEKGKATTTQGARKELAKIDIEAAVDAAMKREQNPPGTAQELRIALIEKGGLLDGKWLPEVGEGETLEQYERTVKSANYLDKCDYIGTVMRGGSAGHRTVDPFAGGGALIHAASFLERAIAEAPTEVVVNGNVADQLARDARTKSRAEEVAENGDKISVTCKRAGLAMRGLLGTWARVRFVSGDMFVIEGYIMDGVTSSANRRAKVAIFVDTTGNHLNDALDAEGTDGAQRILDLARSPSYAASLVAEAGERLGLKSVGDFFALPIEMRQELVRNFRIGAASRNAIAWTVDRRGLEVLTGNIRLGSKPGDARIFHEYFHQMIAMFAHLGMFSKSDIETFRGKFGEPPPGTGWLFDEEKAAKRFMQFIYEGPHGLLKSNTKGARDADGNRAIRSLFQRIYDFISALFKAIAGGFSYNNTNAERLLFSFALRGVAAMSNERLAELDEASAVDATKVGAGYLKSRAAGGVRGDNHVSHELIHVRTRKSGAFVSPRSNFSPEVAAEPNRGRIFRAATVKELYDYAMSRGGSDVQEPSVWQWDAIADSQYAKFREATGTAESVDAGTDAEMFNFVRMLADARKESRDAAGNVTGTSFDYSQARNAITGYLTFVRGGDNASYDRAEDAEALDAELRDAFNKASPDTSFTASERSPDGLWSGGYRFDVELPDVAPVSARVGPPVAIAGRLIAESLDAKLRNEGSWGRGLERVHDLYRGSDPVSLAEWTRDDAVVRAGLWDALRVLHPDSQGVSPVKDGPGGGVDGLDNNLVYTVALDMVSRIGSSYVDPNTLTPGSKAYLMKMGADADKSGVKAHASAYDVSAWILTSGGIEPGEPVRDAYARIESLLDSSAVKGDANLYAAIQRILHLLEPVRKAMDDRTQLIGHLRGTVEDVFDVAIPALTAGLDYAGRGAQGEIRDYTLLNDSDVGKDEQGYAAENRRMYSGIFQSNDLEVQSALKLAIGTVFRAKASLKYYADTSTVPAGPEDIAFANQMAGMFARNLTPEEWCATHAIGNSNLLDNEGLIEHYDQPFFVADNMEAWTASLVRPTFGGIDLREAMTTDDFAGIRAEIQNLENWQAFLMGDSTEAGGRLLAIMLHEPKFAMDSGVIRYRISGDKILGFDNYNRKTCDVTLTHNELRTIDMYKKSLNAYIRGQKMVLTGVHRLHFTLDDASDLDHATEYGNIAEMFSHKQGEKVKPRWFQVELWRLQDQLSDDFLGVERESDGKTFKSVRPGGFYDRVAKAMQVAISQTAQEYETLKSASELASKSAEVRARLERNGVVIPTFTEENARELEKFDFNDRVLAKLEAAGLAVCWYSEDGRRKEGTIAMPVDEIEGIFRGSTAFGKLTSEARWAGVEGYVGGRTQAERDEQKARREAAFSREALVQPYREVWGRLARFVREHAWLTQGDAKYLTAFGTPLPFFQGSGMFMYNAVRVSRLADPLRNPVEKLGEKEQAYLKICTKETAGLTLDQLNDVDEGLRARTLDTFARLLGVQDKMTTEQVAEAINRGDFTEGGRHGDLMRRYGISVQPHAFVGEMADAIYSLYCNRAFTFAQGREMTAAQVRETLDFLDIHDSHRGASVAGGVNGGMGVTDDMMYRNHGVLPANFQLGHMVRIAAEGITNAIMHRATFMSLMTTPAGDGAPVYFMRPGDDAATLSGIPDQCWGAIARWWADYHGLAYDEAATGVRNAQRIYDLLVEKGMTDEKGRKTWRLRDRMGMSDHRYVPIDSNDSDLISVSGVMCMEDAPGDSASSALNSFAGGEAAGYMKQFINVGRHFGFLARRKVMRHALSWSKTASVTFSLFFPLATRFESPIGAVGAIPTALGNTKWGSNSIRKHPELFNALMKIFPGSGWFTKDFVGYADIIEMMDSNDPFYAELVSWANSLGITLSSSLDNPMEPTKSAVASDIQRMKEHVRVAMGESAAAKFGRLMDTMVLRSGDKAFRYALNATKLAVVAQMAMKLRHAAKRRGKAFDPIRDMRRYAAYINAELGGIDERRYAWAHPAFRRVMNFMLFSWQWTRGAWEAGGGNVIEDFVFGGHSSTREERRYILGRWARMYCEIMIGFPVLMQAALRGLAKAMGEDDPDGKLWTWENEDKTNLTAFDVTPIMKVMAKHESVANIAGRAGAGALGLFKFGLPGAIGGLLVGDRLVPKYTGRDEANRKTRGRRYYMHFGKQGWEFFRWFDDPFKQFASKLSMPAQRFLEGVFGRNLTYLDKGMAWDDMGVVERWLNPTLNSATMNMAKAFMPFSAGQMMSFGDAGFLPILGPVQMGASQRSIRTRLEAEITRWARNDRTAYSWGTGRKGGGKAAKRLASRFMPTLEDARRNGLKPQAELNAALASVATRLYGRLLDLLPENATDSYDVAEVERVCRQLNRVLSRKASVLKSVKKSFNDRLNSSWKSLPPELRARYRAIIARTMENPFSGLPADLPMNVRRDY